MASPSRHTHKRATSSHRHNPITPSGLRQTHTVSTPLGPEHDNGSQDAPTTLPVDLTRTNTSRGTAMSPPLSPVGVRGRIGGFDEATPPAGPSGSGRRMTEATALLRDWRERPHPGPCSHGTFSPRPGTPSSTIIERVESDPGGASHDETESTTSSIPVLDAVIGGLMGLPDWKKKLAKRAMSNKMSSSGSLAKEAGVKDSVYM